MPNIPLKVSAHQAYRSPQVPLICIQFPPLNCTYMHLNEDQLVLQKWKHISFSMLWFWYLFCRFKKFDNKYLKKILIREHQPKSSLVSLYKKMEIKLAIEMAESGMKISKSSTTSLQWVPTHWSFAEQGQDRDKNEEIAKVFHYLIEM